MALTTGTNQTSAMKVRNTYRNARDHRLRLAGRFTTVSCALMSRPLDSC